MAGGPEADWLLRGLECKKRSFRRPCIRLFDAITRTIEDSLVRLSSPWAVDEILLR